MSSLLDDSPGEISLLSRTLLADEPDDVSRRKRVGAGATDNFTSLIHLIRDKEEECSQKLTQKAKEVDQWLEAKQRAINSVDRKVSSLQKTCDQLSSRFTKQKHSFRSSIKDVFDVYKSDCDKLQHKYSTKWTEWEKFEEKSLAESAAKSSSILRDFWKEFEDTQHVLQNFARATV